MKLCNGKNTTNKIKSKQNLTSATLNHIEFSFLSLILENIFYWFIVSATLKPPPTLTLLWIGKIFLWKLQSPPPPCFLLVTITLPQQASIREIIGRSSCKAIFTIFTTILNHGKKTKIMAFPFLLKCFKLLSSLNFGKNFPSLSMGEDSQYAIKFIFQDTLTNGVKTVLESFWQIQTMSVERSPIG